MLRICRLTEIPPNPIKKAQTIILLKIDWLEIKAILDTPCVSSIIPAIIPFEKDNGIFKKLRIGASIFEDKLSILLLSNIEIITENKTINPPIKRTVFIAFIIDLDKTSPKFLLDIWLGLTRMV